LNPPKLTVVIPVYNEKNSLLEIIRRVQAVPIEKEIILVDDFSTGRPDNLAQVQNIAAGLSFVVGLLANSSAPGYGRIWRLPVSFTIDRAGRLAEDGWKLKQPSWTPERLAEVVTPLLQG